MTVITRAMVLAAGLGKRLRPITDTIPKPMVHVGGKPLVDYALDQLHAFGVNDAVVNSSYKAEILEAHLATRTTPRITISREPEPLETGGGIAQALAHLGSAPFVAMNSDTICVDGLGEAALQRMADAWDDTAMDALLLLHPTEKAIGFAGDGDFHRAEDGQLRRRAAEETAPYVFTGVQILHPRLFMGCPDGAFSMNVLYNKALQADGRLGRIGSLVHTGDWLHVGDVDGLEKANLYFAMNRR